MCLESTREASDDVTVDGQGFVQTSKPVENISVYEASVLFFHVKVIAGAARLFYDRVGLAAFARAAYVAVLVPYALTAFAAVVNNFTLTLI